MILISGPCVIEGDGSTTIETAQRLADMAYKRDVQLIFKTSFDKANRTSNSSYRGVGLDMAKEIFKTIKEKTGLPVTTDVHCTDDVWELAPVVDVLQIPALLSRQTDLIKACALHCKAMSIKKGQFIAPHNIDHMIRKSYDTNPDAQLMVIERGSCFGYNDLVVDFRSFPIMSKLTEHRGTPIIFDATHTVQYPQASAGSSGGDRSFVAPLARAAGASGFVDGFFIETHHEPDAALCDGPCMVKLDDMPVLLDQLIGAVNYGQEASGRNSRAIRV